MVNEVSYVSQLDFLEYNFWVVIYVGRVIKGPMLFVWDSLYELFHSCMCVLVPLYYQDRCYLVLSGEAIEKAHPVGCSQMLQHCRTDVGSPSGIHPFWPC